MSLMDVTIHLAKAANVAVAGQVDVLGLGWDVIGPGPLPPHVLMVSVKLPAGYAGQPVDVGIRLLDSAGEPVVLGEEKSAQSVEINSQITPPPASAVPAGLQGGVLAVVEVGSGMLLEPGLYEWAVSVAGESSPAWRRRFYVRAKADEFPTATATG